MVFYAIDFSLTFLISPDVGPIDYDANGNIQKLVRNKDPDNQNSTAMDALAYNYDPDKPNRLLWVDDGEGDVPDADDLDDQANGNYGYNSTGQLVHDFSQDIFYIYNASGLVAEVERNGLPLVKFLYNDRNHRVRKEIYGNGNLIYTLYYVRDVAGQVMAVYNDVGGSPALEEQPIYGAGRLGIAYNGNNNEKTYVYELTDHLGNVRAVFTKSNNDANLEGYTDYYPFGMPNRGLMNAYGYRYAFQGQEKDAETGKEAFKLRLWDGRIGRWSSPDPARQFASPYLGMGNNPTNGVDTDGAFWEELGNWFSGKGWNSNAALEFQANGGTLGEWTGDSFTGYRNAASTIDGEVVGTTFNAVQDINSDAAAGFRVSAGLQLGFDISDTFTVDAAIFRTTLIEYDYLKDEWYDTFTNTSESRIEFLSAELAGGGAGFGWKFSRVGKKNSNLFDANFSGEVQGGFTSLLQFGYKFDDESPLNGFYSQHGVEAGGSLIIKVEIYHRHRFYHGKVLNN